MKTSRRVFVVSALIVAAAAVAPVAMIEAQDLASTRPEYVGMSTERLERLSAAMQRYVEGDQLSGAVVQVARRGRTVYLEAFGRLDIDESVPMTTDAIFRIASQTKAVISVGVMILQEEGRLLIGSPVGRYLPEYMKTTVAVPKEGGGYDIVEADRPITIRDLLTHTAGVGYGNGPAADLWEEAGIQGWYFADRDEPIRQTVERIASLPFDAQPGTRFVYGYSTDILGALIEVVSGMPLDRFLEDRILGPLSMDDTFFYAPDDKDDRLATVYSSVEGGGIIEAPDPGHMVGQGAYVEGPRKSFSGGAGLLSTANDYARFLQMLLNGGEFDGARVLSPKTVELMTVSHIGDIEFMPGAKFGLGFLVVEDLGAFGAPSTVGQYAWGGAYHSSYWVDPAEELVVVYFTQLIPALKIDDHGVLRALVYQAILE